MFEIPNSLWRLLTGVLFMALAATMAGKAHWPAWGLIGLQAVVLAAVYLLLRDKRPDARTLRSILTEIYEDDAAHSIGWLGHATGIVMSGFLATAFFAMARELANDVGPWTAHVFFASLAGCIFLFGFAVFIVEATKKTLWGHKPPKPKRKSAVNFREYLE